jgi:endonuclease-8
MANLAARGDLELGLALLNQTVLATGNVFKSSGLRLRIEPLPQSLDAHADQLAAIIATARKFLLANVTESSGHRRTTGRTDREEFLWVYGRAGQPCRRCATPIRSQKHTTDGRISFWCPVCQQ